MITTPLTRLLGIEAPIIQAPLGGPWPPFVDLSIAVCEAGALGSIPAVFRSAGDLRADLAAVRAATGRPYAVNHTMRPFDEQAFRAGLEAAPAVVSFALGMIPALIERTHDAGARFVQQVHTVAQAEAAAEAGADVVVAQGGEAGGFGGGPGTLVLVPQVVDAVSPVPVVAAGGIADGRGLAAALLLGAAGVQVGTRFLASREAATPETWKERIVTARSEDTVRATFMNELAPRDEGGFATVPRVLRNDFIDRWHGRPEELAAHREVVAAQLRDALASGRAHELIEPTGEAAGLVREVLPAGEIIRRMVAEAEGLLSAAAGMLG